MSKRSDYFHINDKHGMHGRHQVKTELSQLPGVLSVAVSKDGGRVSVDYDTTGITGDRIEDAIGDLGYTIMTHTSTEHRM